MQLSSTVLRLQSALDEILKTDFDALSGVQSKHLLQQLARANNKLDSITATCAARAIEGNQHVVDGARTSADWLAQQTGISRKSAHGCLLAQKRIAREPDVFLAVQSGELSWQKAEVIARSKDPDLLLSMAYDNTVEELQRAAAALAMRKARTEGTVAEHQESLRSSSYWSDADGMFNQHNRMTPAEGAEYLARYRAHEDLAFQNNRKSVARKMVRQVRADAFLAMMRSTGNTKTRHVVNVHVSYEAMMRGWVQEVGEFCEIPGLGPIPVAMAQGLLGDCILRLLVTCGNQLVWSGEANQELPDRIKRSVIAKYRGRQQLCDTG